jgi:hypothetical protein
VKLPRHATYAKVLRAACVLTLVALALMTWSILSPHAAPILVAMSVGQALGTVAFATFLVVVYADLRRLRRAAHAAREAGIALPGPESAAPPLPPPSNKD